MSSALRSLNILLVLLTCVASIWAWINLPEMERYPVHWNARGEADAFGSKKAVLLNLSIMPFTALFMYVVLRICSGLSGAKDAMKNNRLVFDILMHSLLWLFLVIGIFIASQYMDKDAGEGSPLKVEIMLRLLPIFLAIFFIVIGNILPKFRQNYFIGVRTPWTLKSKMTWEATHRVTARLWVGAGVLTLIAQLFTSPEQGLFITIALLLGASFGAIIYSYVYYLKAPDR